MAVRVKSLDEMIREIIASLQAGESGRPAFTLLVGSGFSFPIIPTPTQMLKGDIAWWRYCKQQRIDGRFRHQAEVVAEGLAMPDHVVEFEREMWKPIHAKAAASQDTAFPLTVDGLPDLSTPNAIGLAYQAAMADGLMNNRMRRQYLRDAIERSYPKVNGAHIFLAGILEAQETWDWGAPFCRTIFTTNFDPLLQRSLQLVNKLYYMTDRPDVLEPPDDDGNKAIHLVYTHGSVHRYDLLNTEDQIKHARERNAPTLIEYFRRHGVIVIGYSGWADTTMEALASCPSFDSNLYWCDIHPAADAETRLRPEVMKILEAPEKHAYYVPIAGADEAMRLLHRELKLGDVPKFILAPVDTMITQLKSIDVPSEPPASSEPEATPLSTSLAALLEGTLARLNVAKSAFDDPSIVKPASAEGEEEVAKALIAQLLSDAVVAYSQGKRDHAIVLWSTVIATPVVPAKDRATALFNRGVASGESGETTKAIADYTAVIDIPEAPAGQKAQALNNRGITWRHSGESMKAIADYTAVIDMPHAPADQKAMALYNRGIAWGKSGEPTKEIADYMAVIDMPDAAVGQKAKALNNRGIAWGQNGDTTKEIADFTTVIDLPDAPVDQKAKALFNRGFAWRRIGETTKAIADYTAVIDMPDAPVEQKAKALNNRGFAWGKSGETTKEISDYATVIDMSDAPAEPKANALNNRGLTWLESGETTKAIADYTAVIDMPDAPADQKAKALYNRGVAWGKSGETTKEIADYTAVIDMPDAPADQKAEALYNRGITWGQRGETTKEIADYTAVIDMPDAPADQKAEALYNRGIAWGKSGESTKEIADYTAVIDMTDAPAGQKALALINRGFASRKSGESTKAIADYTAVIDMTDAPAGQKAKALINRGFAWGQSGESTREISDYTAVIDMTDAPADQKAIAFLNRGWTLFADLDDAVSMVGDSQKAIAIDEDNLNARSNLALGLLLTGEAGAALTEYETLLARTSDIAVIRTAIDDLETALRKRPEIAEAAKILDRLRSSIPGKDDDAGGDALPSTEALS